MKNTNLKRFTLAKRLILMLVMSVIFSFQLQGQPVLLKDIIVGSVSSEPDNFRHYNGNLLIDARKFTDPNNYILENWTSDGTTNGTVFLGATKERLTYFKNASYYFQNANTGTLTLSRSVGTNAPTNIKTFPSQFLGSRIYPATDVFYFVNSMPNPAGACGISSGDAADVLWRSDGTTTGTTQLGIIAQCKTSGSNNFQDGLTSGNNFFFVLRENEVCASVNVFDGTAFKRIDNGCYPVSFQLLATDGNGSVYFSKSGVSTISPVEIFRYANGQSTKISDTNAPLSSQVPTTGKTAVPLVGLNGSGLWLTDGTANGTKRILNQNTLYTFRNAAGNLFAVVRADLNSETNLWYISDAGPVFLNALSNREVGYSPFLAIGNTLFFNNKTVNNGIELWKQDLITIPNTGQYCTSKGIAPWELWLGNVKFNTLNNTSDKFKDYATLGYSDYTNLTTIVAKGQTYPLSITPALSWIGNLPNAFCRVWIDFNNNKTFEANELVLEKTNANPLTQSVLIPTAAVTGAVRMRVAIKWGAYPTACETFDRGEVEDYTINITEGSSPCANDIEPPVIVNCPASETRNISSGECVTLVWTPPTATDNCSTPQLSFRTKSGNVLRPESTATQAIFNTCISDSMFYTATDARGNRSVCAFAITLANTCQPNYASNRGTVTFNLTTTGNCASHKWEILADYYPCSRPCQYQPWGRTSVTPNVTVTRVTSLCSQISLDSACFPIGRTMLIYTGGNGQSDTIVVNVTQQTTGNYCSSKSTLPWEYWISNVKFNTINNTSDKFKDFSTLGYSDYTSVSTSLNKGQSYPLSITPGLSWIGNVPNAYARAWIDFNNNKTFEANELVLEKTNANPLTQSILIPTTAVTGAVRMRVAVKFGSYPTACETFAKGEVEDYTINIGGTAQCNGQIICPRDTTITIAAPATTYCGGMPPPTVDLTACNFTTTNLSLLPLCYPLGTSSATWRMNFSNGGFSDCVFKVTVKQATTGGTCKQYTGADVLYRCSTPCASTYQWKPLGMTTSDVSFDLCQAKFYKTDGVTFQQNSNGTAILRGTFRDATWTPIVVEMNLSGGSSTGAGQSDYCTTPNSAGWYYYSSMTGTFKRGSSAAVPISSVAPATFGFQIGLGAALYSTTTLGIAGNFRFDGSTVGGNIAMLLNNETTCTTNALAARKSIFDLEAKAEIDQAKLLFVSNESADVDFFEVQKLDNQGVFKTISTVNSTHRAEIQPYTFTDNQITEGVNVYQIKATKVSGEVIVSPMRDVEFKNLNTLFAFPNPTADELSISLRNYTDSEAKVLIYNSLGNLEKTIVLDRVTETTIRTDVSHLPVGQYFVRLVAKGKRDAVTKFRILR